MSIHLITGYAGAGHVTAADAGCFNAGVCGTSKYVMATGTQFAYTLESNNEIKIGSGDLIDQGRHINIPQNSEESLTIDNGAQNKIRIDTIAVRYRRDTSTGIETASILNVKGEEVTIGTTPVPATLTSGDIFNGDTTDDFALYYITISNLAVTNVTPAFTVIPSLGNIADKIYPVGAIYMSVNVADPSTLFGGSWEALSGRFLLGAGDSYSAGSTGGASSKTLTLAELPAHNHTLGSHTHTVPNHAHVIPAHNHTASTSSSGAHTHTVTRNKVAASGTARYASQTGSGAGTVTTSSSGAHTHTVTVVNCNAFDTISSGACVTGVASGTTGATGSGTAFSIMPPYLAVYMWKRTA